MKIFDSIKKRWIQSKANKYALKRQEALSKSSCYQQLANDHYNMYIFRKYSLLAKYYLQSANHYNILSKSEQNLADKYLNKLLALWKKI